jgi:hypothetical protein
VTAGRDPEQPGLTGERTPEHPALPAGLPAGLVDVHDRRPFDLPLKPGVRCGQRITGALDDRVHCPGRDLDPEKLTGELGRVTTRDTVADRERDDSGLEPRPECPPRLERRLGCRDRCALRAANPVQPMLGHPDRDRRQLRDLTPRRLNPLDALPLDELVRTRPAPLGPVLDELVNPLRWK